MTLLKWGHYFMTWGHGPFFDSGQKETPGSYHQLLSQSNELPMMKGPCSGIWVFPTVDRRYCAGKMTPIMLSWEHFLRTFTSRPSVSNLAALPSEYLLPVLFFIPIIAMISFFTGLPSDPPLKVNNF